MNICCNIFFFFFGSGTNWPSLSYAYTHSYFHGLTCYDKESLLPHPYQVKHINGILHKVLVFIVYAPTFYVHILTQEVVTSFIIISVPSISSLPHLNRLCPKPTYTFHPAAGCCDDRALPPSIHLVKLCYIIYIFLNRSSGCGRIW